jgi:hypothetical protein
VNTADQFQAILDQITHLVNQILNLAASLAAIIVLAIVIVIIIYGFRALSRTPTLTQEGRGLLDYGNLLIVSVGLLLGLVGFLVILMFASAWDRTVALGFLTAFFGLITGLVGTFLALKRVAT